MPALQTAPQARRVSSALAAPRRRLGMDRRRFLRTSCGMAAFVAMERVYGALSTWASPRPVEPRHARPLRRAAHQPIDRRAAPLRARRLPWDGILELGEAAERWNPVLEREGVTLAALQVRELPEEVFLDSDTNVGLVSAAPPDGPSHSIVSNATSRARAIVNEIAARAHARARVIGPASGWLDEIDRARGALPDSWKGYVGDPLAPRSTLAARTTRSSSTRSTRRW
jgi:hypothetical protein